MELEEIQSVPSRVAVAEALRRRIALGLYAPGDRLPSERVLAELLGVGRMTVRDAIRLLAEEGLLATSRGRWGGTVVLDRTERRGRRTGVTAQLVRDVRDNFDFRCAVEPLAARLAAERAADEQRWAIRGLAEGEAASIGQFRALDSRFHLTIAEAAGNALVLEAIRSSRGDFFRWADVAWERLDWDALPVKERDFGRRHRPIAEAILAADAGAAETAMRDHLLEGRAMYIRAIKRALRTVATRDA